MPNTERLMSSETMAYGRNANENNKIAQRNDQRNVVGRDRDTALASLACSFSQAKAEHSQNA
jgi:hypothetical protein